jgi:hypothetical protein
VTFWIGFCAVISAAGELVGTWTVWTTYRQSSTFAANLSAQIIYTRDNEPSYNDPSHVFYIVLNAIDTAIGPMKSRRSTSLGLAAFAIGALAGLAAALLALNSN